MNRIWNRAGIATSITAITAVSVLAFGGVAYADIIKDSIEGSDLIALTAGSSVSETAMIWVTATNGETEDTSGNRCNIDPGEPALELTVITPAGVTPNPATVAITNCTGQFPVSFTAGAAAVSGDVTVVINPRVGDLASNYNNNVRIPITITQPEVTNTKPSVSISETDATYEFGSEPVPTCSVVDAEDGPSSFDAAVSGELSHGLGILTATCDYTDAGELPATTATVTYEIVDTGNPTIEFTLTPAVPNGTNGWYTTDVGVDFTCEDEGGSGIATCEGDETLDEDANQSVTGTATDWAGNTVTEIVSGINIDKTAPTVALLGGPTGSYYYGDDPAVPTCDAADALSGIASCVVTGGGTATGPHSYTATATDNAGNTSTATLAYTVLAWNVTGFYSPVDMSGVWNTVKGGSTVPLKFEIFSGTELTSTSAVKNFTATAVSCPNSLAVTDAIEFVTTGGTSLRYDSTSGQFIQNWATPKKPGACVKVTMTTQDGSTISANFILK